MAEKGGFREGAGRPPGRLNDATLTANEQKRIAREVIREVVIERLPDVVKAESAELAELLTEAAS